LDSVDQVPFVGVGQTGAYVVQWHPGHFFDLDVFVAKFSAERFEQEVHLADRCLLGSFAFL